jgi:heme/copper-type cytochrome/quinol oxidase subunit 2
MRGNGYFYYPTPSCIDVAFADGSVHLLPANALTAERLKSLLAIGGCNETVMESLAQQADGNADLLLNWPHCVGLPIWLTSAVILLILAAKGRRAARRRDAARPA